MPAEDLKGVESVDTGFDSGDLKGVQSSEERFWEDFEPQGWEKEVFGKRHNTWAAIKTLETLMPFGKFLGVTPSGRGQWEAKSTKEQLIEAGLDSLVFLPLPLVGKGFRSFVKKTLGGAAGKFPGRKAIKHELQLMDKIGGKVTPYIEHTADDVLLRDFGLSITEVQAFNNKTIPDLLFKQSPSEGLIKALDATSLKKGKIELTKRAKKMWNYAKRPEGFKIWDHYRNQFTKEVNKIMGAPYMTKENRERTFKVLTENLIGESMSRAVTLESASPKLFANLALRMIDDPGKFVKMSSLGKGSLFPVKMRPVRVVFGAADEFFGTWKNVYQRGKNAFMNANAYGFEQVEKFSAILATKGLGALKKKASGDFRFKLGKGLKDDYFAAGEKIVEIGELSQAAAPEMLLKKIYADQTPGVKKFIDAWYEWSDSLYLDQVKMVLPRLFKEAGANKSMMVALEREMVKPQLGIISQLEKAFAPNQDLFTYGKAAIVREQFKRVEKLIDQGVAAKWITSDQGAALRATALMKGAGGGKKTGFVDYLDNYVTRISQSHSFKNSAVAETLTKGNLRAFYTKPRTEPLGHDLTTNIGKLVESRARAQGKEIMFYPEIKKISDFAGKLPQDYQEYTAHWIFRMLGQPSPADIKLAKWMTGSYGRLERALFGPGKGVWDEHRVMNLSHNVNNLIYMGGLGFKPFSAMRNFFQPLLLVPTDLGGAKDFRWYLKGLAKATDPETRSYIRNELKAIQEYAPELHLRAQAVPVGKRLVVGGKTLDLPDTQQIRDVSMWMFKMSDRFNRYVTGGASISKWDHWASTFINPKTGLGNTQFINKMNIKGRSKWTRTQVEDLLREGGISNVKEAKKLFVNDVISDTQYLYGITDSPLLSHTWGAPGKMAMVFQSWWMNYGELLAKWAKTGDAGTKANRLFGFMFSAAIGEQLIEPLWGRGTAARTVGLGPFPGEISEFAIPPAYAPVYHALKAMVNLGKGDLASVQRSGQALLRSATMFTPGGLQLAATAKGIKEEGAVGALKSVIRYKKPEDYQFLFGALK